MSGIVGVFDTTNDPSRATIRRFLAQMDYRGPDGSAVAIDGAVGLGCQIFRTRPGAADDGIGRADDVTVALDGRIDGVTEPLANAEGTEDSGTSDAEVLAQLFDARGTEAFDNIVGVFAAIVWDAAAGQLVAACDKTGVRCLYYGRVGERVLIASDSAVITDAFDTRPPINEGLLGEFLVGNLRTTDETFLRGVHRVEAGTYVTLTGTDAARSRYWTPWTIPKIESDPETVARRLRTLFEDAIADRLVGRTPPAVSMSGGLDSTAVGVLATRKAREKESEPPQAYSVLFDETPRIDERTGVEATADACGVPVERIDGDGRWPLDRMDPYRRVLTHHPCIDTSITIADAVTERASERVVLTGIGGNLHDGDRVFYADLLRKGRLGEFVRQAVRDDGSSVKRALVYGVGATALSDWTFLNEIHNRVVGPPWAPYVADEFANRADLETRLSNRPFADAFDDLGRQSLFYQLTDPYMTFALDGVRQVSLTRRVERRHPLLDPRIVEFLFAIPPRYRVGKGRFKRIFRQALEDALPSAVSTSATSENEYSGFLARSLRQNERAFVSRAFTDARIAARGYVPRGTLQRLWREYRSGESVKGSLIWRLLAAELWIREEERKRGRR